jgi:hypothetical protein
MKNTIDFEKRAEAFLEGGLVIWSALPGDLEIWLMAMMALPPQLLCGQKQA